MKKYVAGFLPEVVALITLFLIVGAAQATTYYVDPAIGQDDFTGTNFKISGAVGPWKTTDKVQNADLKAGDIVTFKRGSLFSSGLVIAKNGASAGSGVITFTAYGAGNAPVFKRGNNTSDWANAIEVRGQYIVLDGLSAQAVHHAGIYLANTARHVTVRNCYITNVGIGIFLDSSSNNTITNNTVLSPHMVVNTPQSVNKNDDFGANGVWLNSNCSHNRITRNIFSKCRAPCYDYGNDGGAIEIYLAVPNNANDDNLFSGNRVDEGASVVEIGADPEGRKNGKVTNLTLSYNICYKNGSFCAFHYEEGKLSYENVVVANNTVVEPYDLIAVTLHWQYPVIGYDAGFADYRRTIWRNNIFSVGKDFTKFAENFVATHYNNDYFLENPLTTKYGLTPTTNGNMTANPLFIKYDPTQPFESQNFHLKSGSPAYGKGAYVPGGYNLNNARL